MQCLVLPLDLNQFLVVFLVLKFQFFGLPCSCFAMIIAYIIYYCSIMKVCFSFLGNRVKSLGILVSVDSLDLDIILVGHILLFPIIVALYSCSRFISDLPPPCHGRCILSISAFLASIWLIHSCFLFILLRPCILSSFQ